MAQTWFPGGRYNPKGWRLDIVSLLAVIGDGSVAIHAQEITSSWHCLLPRLIPAPQALLRSSRPRRLPAPPATVSGVHSGVSVSEVNFFANIIHDIDQVHPYEFREYDINLNRGRVAEKKYDEKSKSQKSKKDAKSRIVTSSDVETGASAPSQTGKQTVDAKDQKTDQVERKIKLPMVPPSSKSPMIALTYFSCALSLGAFIWAALIGDGIALLAIAFISIATSMIGLGLWWRPRLAARPVATAVPDGDVVIRTRGGAFIVVRCEESVARELYVGSEQCEYLVKRTTPFQVLSGTGTVLLMVSVVLLGNCTWTMQAVVGGTYILLNGLYWAVSIVHKGYFWNLSRYTYKEKIDKRLKDAHLATNGPPNYTRTLWYAIYSTKSIEWVKNSSATPRTKAWDKWLEEAFRNKDDFKWPAEKRRDFYMAEVAGIRAEGLVASPAQDANTDKA